LEEWGITRIIQQTLVDLGFDIQQAQSGVTILKLLINQQNWVLNTKEKSPYIFTEEILKEDEVRTFLNINRYRGTLYFNKEAFESLMWWLMSTALIRLVSDPEKSLTEDLEILIEAHGLIAKLLEVEEQSEYQVDILLDSLK
jgi:hypothetical protein